MANREIKIALIQEKRKKKGKICLGSKQLEAVTGGDCGEQLQALREQDSCKLL